MGAKDRRSRDQKRKAKLAARARKVRSSADLTPYGGSKYQSSRWATYVYSTELGVYETIQLSNRRLTNNQVKEAFRTLIKRLHEGTSPSLGEEDDPEMEFAKGDEVEFLVWNIRRQWTELFETHKPAGSADLTGILRTLLNSIDAHAWNTSPERGYVAYLDSFMRNTVPLSAGGKKAEKVIEKIYDAGTEGDELLVNDEQGRPEGTIRVVPNIFSDRDHKDDE